MHTAGPNSGIRNRGGKEARPRCARRFRRSEILQGEGGPRKTRGLGFRAVPARTRGFEPFLLRMWFREQFLKIGLNGSSRSGSGQEKNQHRSWKTKPQKYFHLLLDAKLPAKGFAHCRRPSPVVQGWPAAC